MCTAPLRASFSATAIALVTMWLPFGGHALAADIGTALGWSYRIVAENLPQVDNLAIGPDRTLYATLELANGAGRVVQIGEKVHTPILDNLNRPDGLLIFRGRLYVTEEVIPGRLIAVDLDTERVVVLGRFRNPEGIGVLPDGSLVISEDVRDGALIQLGRDGTRTILQDGLNRPEGLVVGPDGVILVAETGTGRVLAIQDGRSRVVMGGLHQPDQVALGWEGNLWVTEDQNPGRMVRIGADGPEPIAWGLASPQGMVFLGDTLYVAEQDRGRILGFYRDMDLDGRGRGAELPQRQRPLSDTE